MPLPLRLIPVLDLLNGVVVRGVAGQRESYRPIESRIVDSCDALDVARAFREKFALTELYVADLDAIIHQKRNDAILARLADDGFRLMIDAGVRSMRDAEAIARLGEVSIIAGLETIPGPSLLSDLCRRFTPGRIVFSLDLRGGRLLGDFRAWKSKEPLAAATEAIESGVRRMIVIDLAQVGVSEGPGSLALCRAIRAADSDLEITSGGGVRSVTDLDAMAASGINAALVATALHNGTIAPLR